MKHRLYRQESSTLSESLLFATKPNYQQREQQNQTYISQVAESHIESIINARHKKSGKMQWTREGAHKVLQIQESIASNEWSNRWQEPVLIALGVAA